MNKELQIESLMNEYDSIIESFIDKSIIKDLEDEFNKLPENYQIYINIDVIGDYGKGYIQFGEPVDVVSIAYANGIGSEHNISYNTKSGKRTFELNLLNNTKRIYTLCTEGSNVSTKDLDRYLNNITDDIKAIKGIVNPKTDYIVSLSYSNGNSENIDLPKLKEICSRVFLDKAIHIGKKSEYDQKKVQHYRTLDETTFVDSKSNKSKVINPNMILNVKDFSTSTIDWEMNEYVENGVRIGVTAWDNNRMIDESIVEKYSQLESIQLMDEVEGYMSYHGDLTAKKLVDKLLSIGFNTILLV
jgi:hypothetical protein